MDWAMMIFLVVAGITVASLRWWSAYEAGKIGHDGVARGLTTASPAATPQGMSRDAP